VTLPKGRKRLWLSLRNSTDSPKLFTFDVANSPVNGTIAIRPDGMVNVFEAETGKTYAISVAVEDGDGGEYDWSVDERTSSLVVELTDDELRFKEVQML